MRVKLSALTVGMALAFALNVSAQSTNFYNIILDEYGHGYYGVQTVQGTLPFSTTLVDPVDQANDHPPVGPTLSFALPPGWSLTTAGDEVIFDTLFVTKSDVVRFTGSRIFVYSDTNDVDSPVPLADVGIPTFLQAGAVPTTEVTNMASLMPSGLHITPGSEGANGIVWTATGTQPGSINDGTGHPTSVNYYFVSDGVIVPEPSTVSLVVAGLLGAIGLIRRRK
jgi:PEP-CTERM motif